MAFGKKRKKKMKQCRRKIKNKYEHTHTHTRKRQLERSEKKGGGENRKYEDGKIKRIHMKPWTHRVQKI